MGHRGQLLHASDSIGSSDRHWLPCGRPAAGEGNFRSPGAPGSSQECSATSCCSSQVLKSRKQDAASSADCCPEEYRAAGVPPHMAESWEGPWQ